MLTRSLGEVEVEVMRFARELQSAEAATVVALSGDLGAGKTSFTQALARSFGITESVVSPTFVIQKAYDAPSGPFKRLIHIDAYRLKSAHELEVLGWQDLISNPENLIVIEWPERVAGLIPEGAHRITLEFLDEESRNIFYDR